jgi:hypothetical protein
MSPAVRFPELVTSGFRYVAALFAFDAHLGRNRQKWSSHSIMSRAFLIMVDSEFDFTEQSLTAQTRKE